MYKLNSLVINIVNKYQEYSSHTQKRCRYHPTCSEYTKIAFQNKNFFYASILSIWRILRCNPFSKGGYDPVPGTHKDND